MPPQTKGKVQLNDLSSSLSRQTERDRDRGGRPKLISAQVEKLPTRRPSVQQWAEPQQKDKVQHCDKCVYIQVLEQKSEKCRKGKVGRTLWSFRQLFSAGRNKISSLFRSTYHHWILYFRVSFTRMSETHHYLTASRYSNTRSTALTVKFDGCKSPTSILLTTLPIQSVVIVIELKLWCVPLLQHGVCGSDTAMTPLWSCEQV